MNPKKIAIFIVGILLSLLIFTFFSHDITTSEGEVIHGVEVASMPVKYPSFSDITEPTPKQENDKALEIIQKDSDPKGKNYYSEKNMLNREKVLKDSLYQILQKGNPPLISNIEGKIYYPGNPQEFVEKLHKKLSQRKCHILHYGDSKTEGDRITANIRNGLQAIYGGSGPGYFSLKQPYRQRSLDYTTTGNWYRYALFSATQRNKKELLPNNQYGLYANVSRFTPAKAKPSKEPQQASIIIKPSYKYFPRLRKYSNLELYYGNCLTSTTIEVFKNKELLWEEKLITDGKYHKININLNGTPKELEIVFTGVQSPDFYGAALTSGSGIQIDNIPVRGDTGYHFPRLQSTFADMSNDLSPDIFIFQYGGNIVPYLTPEKIKTGVKRIINSINWVKKRNPNALCIWITPSDMLRQSDKKSFALLPDFVKEMKEQALANDIAFWSMYEAMGGANSMRTWVDNGLASKADYIHFTNKGTVKISELFLQELRENLLSVQPAELYKDN